MLAVAVVPLALAQPLGHKQIAIPIHTHEFMISAMIQRHSKPDVFAKCRSPLQQPTFAWHARAAFLCAAHCHTHQHEDCVHVYIACTYPMWPSMMAERSQSALHALSMPDAIAKWFGSLLGTLLIADPGGK